MNVYEKYVVMVLERCILPGNIFAKQFSKDFRRLLDFGRFKTSKNSKKKKKETIKTIRHFFMSTRFTETVQSNEVS